MSDNSTIIITGGAGFIGSHTCVELANHFELVVIDNLYNSSQASIHKVEELTNQRITFYQEDLLNIDNIEPIFEKHNPEAVIHFAGLKAVGESVQKPLLYYENNLNSTLNLLKIMKKYQCFNLIFSSSATVYGNQPSPLKETMAIGHGVTNPYGQTKFMIERILKDMCVSSPQWKIISLRYFNPIGAHSSGLIGENPNDIPNNLMPFILKVGVNNNTNVHLGDQFNQLKIFGNDYSTKDGTCERDFIHVVDLAKGHLAALQKINKLSGYHVFNLGTGRGSSVFEVVKAYETISQREIKMEIEARRFGDVAELYADPSKAKTVLNWQTTLGLEEMIRDSWNWQSKNPDGYEKDDISMQ